MALSVVAVVELLSAALTYTSLATRILTVDEPASNRTQQPLAGCWGRTFGHRGFGGGCQGLAYDACMDRYVYDRHHNKFGACQWWGFECTFNVAHADPPLLPEECDKDFIEQNIPGGYTKWYRDLCIEEICNIAKVGGWYSDEGSGFWDQLRKLRLSYWNVVPYADAVTVFGRPRGDRAGPWPRDYWSPRWAKFRLEGYVGWAQAIQERCPVPPAWTGVWWNQDLFADMIYSDGPDLYWAQNQCP